MITLQVHNVRSATVNRAEPDHWVTLYFGNNDRVAIHCKTRIQAAAIALAINGRVDAELDSEASA